MMTVSGTRAEPMDPVDVAWLHMDRPANLMVVNTVLWFDAPVDQASVLEMFGERVVSRFRRFRQRVADPALTLAPWAAPDWVDDAGFALADHVSRTRLPVPGDQRALQRAASDLAGGRCAAGRCGNCTCSTAMVTAARCCCAPTTPSPTAAPSCRSCCRWPIRWTPVSTPVCCRCTMTLPGRRCCPGRAGAPPGGRWRRPGVRGRLPVILARCWGLRSLTPQGSGLVAQPGPIRPCCASSASG